MMPTTPRRPVVLAALAAALCAVVALPAQAQAGYPRKPRPATRTSPSA